MNMNNEASRMVFYQPGNNNVFDEAVDKGTGYVGIYSGMTLASAQAQGAQLMTEAEASQLVDAAHVKAPKPCSEERFMDMLEVLPPQDWRTTPDSESFKLQERTTGNITLIMVRIGDAYWEMEDMVNLTHNDICGKVNALFNVSCLNFQSEQMAMRHITADFDGMGEQDYLIGAAAHSDLLVAAIESSDSNAAGIATQIDERVYFYTDAAHLWAAESALIEHIKASEN
jgi:hypothetical protein